MNIIPRSYIHDDSDLYRAQTGYFVGFPIGVIHSRVWSSTHDKIIGHIDRAFRGLYDITGGFDL